MCVAAGEVLDLIVHAFEIDAAAQVITRNRDSWSVGRVELDVATASSIARLVALRQECSPSSDLVPVRTSLVRGPVNFFRPQYGRDWMIEKTGDPGFVDKTRLAARGHYYLYETLSFADGKRNLAQIREAVAAEYGPAPLEEIEEYFRLLESVGIIEFQ